MATVTINIAMDMTNTSTWYGYVYGANSNDIVLTDYATKIAGYRGLNFTYSTDGAVIVVPYNPIAANNRNYIKDLKLNDLDLSNLIEINT
jgi:hypothetical protein